MATWLVLLAGGRGVRFWPLGRRRRPKQLLALLSPQSLLADTWAGVAPLGSLERSWLLTTADLAAACRREVPGLPAARVLAVGTTRVSQRHRLAETDPGAQPRTRRQRAQQHVARLGDQQQRLQMAQNLVRPPVLREFHHAAGQIAVKLLELRFEAREERKSVGCGPGETGHDLIVIQAAQLLRRRF